MEYVLSSSRFETDSDPSSSQTDTEEYPIDVLGISVAQRYSVLVTALDSTTLNWNIHANFNDEMFDVVPEDLQLSEFLLGSRCA